MQTGTPANPQWVKCDGSYYYVWDAKQPQRVPSGISEGNRQDYVRRVGWQGRERGIGSGWVIGVPYDPTGTWWVSLADDASEATLSNPPTVAKPPPGVK